MNKVHISIISAFFIFLLGCTSPVTVKNSQVMLKTGEKVSRLKFVFLNPEMKDVSSSGLNAYKHRFAGDLEKFGPEIESQAMLSFAKYGIGVPETESVQASAESMSTYLKSNSPQTVPVLFLYPTERSDISSNMGQTSSYFFTAVLVGNSKKILWLANLNVRTGGGFIPMVHTSFLMDEIAKRLGDDGFY
jgi:hypothetical protein